MWWGDNYRFQISDSARKILLFIIGLFMLLILFRLFSWGVIIFFFVFPLFRYGNEWFNPNGSQTEKRKREPETILIMPDDKPKRGESAPRYALGDDGELIEVDDREQDRRSADEQPRRAYNRDEYV
jgi:hypothetical protein